MPVEVLLNYLLDAVRVVGDVVTKGRGLCCGRQVDLVDDVVERVACSRRSLATVGARTAHRSTIEAGCRQMTFARTCLRTSLGHLRTCLARTTQLTLCGPHSAVGASSALCRAGRGLSAADLTALLHDSWRYLIFFRIKFRQLSCFFKLNIGVVQTKCKWRNQRTIKLKIKLGKYNNNHNKTKNNADSNYSMKIILLKWV